MKQLVKLWERPSYDGKRFTYYLLYTDEQGRRRQKSLGHADRRKAERQRAQFERKLTMGIVEPGSMKLMDFVEDSLRRTGDQIRESTHKYYLRVHDDLVDRARQATARGLCKNLLQKCCSGDFDPLARKDCQA